MQTHRARLSSCGRPRRPLRVEGRCVRAAGRPLSAATFPSEPRAIFGRTRSASPSLSFSIGAAASPRTRTLGSWLLSSRLLSPPPPAPDFLLPARALSASAGLKSRGLALDQAWAAGNAVVAGLTFHPDHSDFLRISAKAVPLSYRSCAHWSGTFHFLQELGLCIHSLAPWLVQEASLSASPPSTRLPHSADSFLALI